MKLLNRYSHDRRGGDRVGAKRYGVRVVCVPVLKWGSPALATVGVGSKTGPGSDPICVSDPSEVSCLRSVDLGPCLRGAGLT
jgi:hypothetical protein